jgi:hypothetical protein
MSVRSSDRFSEFDSLFQFGVIPLFQLFYNLNLPMVDGFQRLFPGSNDTKAQIFHSNQVVGCGMKVKLPSNLLDAPVYGVAREHQ